MALVLILMSVLPGRARVLTDSPAVGMFTAIAVPVANFDRHMFSTPPGVGTHCEVLSNDWSPDGDALAIVAITQPSHGTAVVDDGAILYTPGRDFPGEDAMTYTISDGSGQQSTATVALENFGLGNRGTYHTTFKKDEIHGGDLQATVSASGLITGRVRVVGKTLAFRGRLDGQGGFTAFFPGQPLTVQTGMQFVRRENGVNLTGYVWPYVFFPSQVGPYSDQLIPVTRVASTLPLGLTSGRLLARLTPATAPSFPHGTGFAAGSLRPTGTVVLAGRLPDGSPFASASPLSQTGQFSISFGIAGRGESAICGTMEHSAVDGFAGLATWKLRNDTKPPYFGFSGSLECGVSKYTPPLRPNSMLPVGAAQSAIADIHFTLPNGALLTPRTVLLPNDIFAFEPPNPDRVQARIDRNTGLMSGALLPRGQGRVARFTGALYPPAGDYKGVLRQGGMAGGVRAFR